MAMRLLCIAALAVIMAPHVACRAVPLETRHTRALRQLGLLGRVLTSPTSSPNLPSQTQLQQSTVAAPGSDPSAIPSSILAPLLSALAKLAADQPASSGSVAKAAAQQASQQQSAVTAAGAPLVSAGGGLAVPLDTVALTALQQGAAGGGNGGIKVVTSNPIRVDNPIKTYQPVLNWLLG